MILPTKIDVAKAKTLERKIEIDNGVALAKQIDSLRSTFAQERVAHENWKRSSVEELNRQVQGLQDGIDAKKRELVLLEEQRQKLIAPLDNEWAKLQEGKAQIEEIKVKLMEDEEEYRIKTIALEETQKRASRSLLKSKQNEAKTEETLQESETLKHAAVKTSEDTKIYQHNQEVYYESRNKDIDQSIKEYKVALQTIEIRERQVEEKESELLIRERDLTRRITNLQRVEGIQ